MNGYYFTHYETSPENLELLREDFRAVMEIVGGDPKYSHDVTSASAVNMSFIRSIRVSLFRGRVTVTYDTERMLPLNSEELFLTNKD